MNMNILTINCKEAINFHVRENFGDLLRDSVYIRLPEIIPLEQERFSGAFR